MTWQEKYPLRKWFTIEKKQVFYVEVTPFENRVDVATIQGSFSLQGCIYTYIKTETFILVHASGLQVLFSIRSR